jgi:hypothetical protein
VVLNIDTVTQDIEQWIVNFVEVPHPALGGWPPCPYARSARMKKSYDVRVGVDPYFDLKNQARWGMGNREVIIYAYDPVEWPYELFSNSLKNANNEHLLKADIIALEDHPTDVEMVNGVCMNQGTYALALVQSLSDLNVKAQTIATKGFYHNWPEDYLQGLFEHRKDPR